MKVQRGHSPIENTRAPAARMVAKFYPLSGENRRGGIDVTSLNASDGPVDYRPPFVVSGWILPVSLISPLDGLRVPAPVVEGGEMFPARFCARRAGTPCVLPLVPAEPRSVGAGAVALTPLPDWFAGAGELCA
jgi:hypothetical protein